MKRSFLLSLVFAFACCLFANQSAQAQYVEGVSILAEEPLYDLVISYSATESDYYTTFYYGPMLNASSMCGGIATMTEPPTVRNFAVCISDSRPV